MAIAIAIPFPSSGSRAAPRAPLIAPLSRSGSRVYSPFGARRLSRPMAVRVTAAGRDPETPARSRSPRALLRRG